MKLEIRQVMDYGALDSERVKLIAIEDCNLKHYMIIDTTYTGERTISNKMRHTFWFEPRELIKGDEIVLYTGEDIAKKTKINGGKNKRYTFYWGLGTAVWNNTGDAAVLFQISGWATTKVI